MAKRKKSDAESTTSSKKSVAASVQASLSSFAKKAGSTLKKTSKKATTILSPKSKKQKTHDLPASDSDSVVEVTPPAMSQSPCGPPNITEADRDELSKWTKHYR